MLKGVRFESSLVSSHFHSSGRKADTEESLWTVIVKNSRQTSTLRVPFQILCCPFAGTSVPCSCFISTSRWDLEFSSRFVFKWPISSSGFGSGTSSWASFALWGGEWGLNRWCPGLLCSTDFFPNILSFPDSWVSLHGTHRCLKGHQRRHSN